MSEHEIGWGRAPDPSRYDVGAGGSAGAGASGADAGTDANAAERFFERAEALRSFGREDEAIAELRRGLGHHPDDADLLGFLGWTLFFAGHPKDAEDAAQRALAARPGDARALNTLSTLTAVDGRFDMSLDFARQMQDSYPDWAVAHLNAATALLADPRGPRAARNARRAEVRECLATARSLAPEDPETLRRASIMFGVLGDEAESSEALDTALAVDPLNEELRILAAAREDRRASGATGNPTVHMMGAAAHEAAAINLLAGVLADSPAQQHLAREISDRVWVRTQWLASLALWLTVALALFAYFLFGEAFDTTSRTRVRLGELFLVVPIMWFVLFFTIRTRGLPKRFLRRLFGQVWWVWIGLALAAVGGLGMIFQALALMARSGESALKLQGSYVGGNTMFLAFVAWVLVVAELLIIAARFVSAKRSGLVPRGLAGVAYARSELRQSLYGFIRVGIAAAVATAPLYASGIARRPEAADACVVAGLALAIGPIVWIMLNLGRYCAVRGGAQRPLAGVLYATAVAVAVAGVAGTWVLADQHAAAFDPPLTPWQEQLRDQNSKLSETQKEIEELSRSLD